jgi:hypothetical protein
MTRQKDDSRVHDQIHISGGWSFDPQDMPDCIDNVEGQNNKKSGDHQSPACPQTGFVVREKDER